ncbi:hypothetical protein CERSUDRAFT_74940 [Gelatoporia subvermispora B]|uniref:F-box domain-containing protein n=1 Tax=Ceriporiopsis subvermispora (strain B) TaxID=914234 RepID=M2R986_CERS8|nr:hypothetical protein CERSUDRAFT_74940 [Gelatoporia subvermispora B]
MTSWLPLLRLLSGFKPVCIPAENTITVPLSGRRSCRGIPGRRIYRFTGIMLVVATPNPALTRRDLEPQQFPTIASFTASDYLLRETQTAYPAIPETLSALEVRHWTKDPRCEELPCVALHDLCGDNPGVEFLRIGKAYEFEEIPRFTKLRTLHCGVIAFDLDESFINALSSLPVLETISLQFYDEVKIHRPSRDIAPRTLSHLQDLTLRGLLNCIVWFSQCTYFPTLRSLSYKDISGDSVEVYLCAVQTMLLKCASTLRYFCLGCSKFNYSFAMEDLFYMCSILQVLRPILSLRDMLGIKIEFSEWADVQVYDEDLIAMGQAWPALRELEVAVHVDFAPLRPTLTVLPKIANLCPSLKRLVLPFLDGHIPAGSYLGPCTTHDLRYLQFHTRLEAQEDQLKAFVENRFSALDAQRTMRRTIEGYMTRVEVGHHPCKSDYAGPINLRLVTLNGWNELLSKVTYLPETLRIVGHIAFQCSRKPPEDEMIGHFFYEEPHRFEGGILDHEWYRFKTLSGYVHHLAQKNDHAIVDLKVFYKLWDRNQRSPLLPSLCSISWYERLDFFLPLTPRTLRALDTSLWRGEVAKKGNVEVTLDAFCSYLLNFECLRVDKNAANTPIWRAPIFSKRLFLDILSSLPSLERLSIGFRVEIPDIQDEVHSSTPSTCLPNLQDLALLGCSHKIQWFLQHIQAPQLRCLAIEDPIKSHLEEYCALVETLVDKCASTLRDISIRVEDHVFGSRSAAAGSSIAKLVQHLLPLPDILSICRLPHDRTSAV